MTSSEEAPDAGSPQEGFTVQDGACALVTGATGGIGGAIARALAEAGVPTVATGRDAEKVAAFAADLEAATGTRCLGVELDVTTPASIDALPGAVEAFGRVEWLVNNAGIADSAPVLAPENAQKLRRMMEVNFYGPLRLFRLFGPGMIERQRGRVVQIASSASLVGYAYVTAYASTKHALLGWTRSAALELVKKGVGISAVCPHYVDSPMTDRNVEAMKSKTGRTDEDLRGFLASQNPGGALVTPDEVAAATLELLRSPRTGVVVELDGDAPRTVDEGLPLS